MAPIPTNRNRKAVLLRRLRQETIIVGGVPTPPGEYRLTDTGREFVRFPVVEMRHDVASEPELMRTLERSRFTGTFTEEARLPDRVAVCLEDLETGLRAAGLVGVDEILVQSDNRPTKFRVKKRNIAVDGHYRDPSVNAEANASAAASAATTASSGGVPSTPRYGSEANGALAGFTGGQSPTSAEKAHVFRRMKMHRYGPTGRA